MQILHIQFKNLNSLAGQWEIDLTHPAFASNGIFAITGPTGAGKTTILDAICLALYGRTPRLGKITKSGNEIMSRQTGECSAEVTFKTQKGCYRCSWRQHRSRKKPDGELQPPSHEIANADTGDILETKTRGVADQIEAATHMNFDQFTRSMLLAQGGFAAFLQAAPDERAPILEQITGTEIYSRISIRVHERRSEERRRLDALQAELAGMQLLPPEDEQRLTERLSQKTLQDAELTRRIAQKHQAVIWSEGIVRLEAELTQLAQAKNMLNTRLEAFAPDQTRLDAAVRALEFAADYAALTAVRNQQEAARRTLHEYHESLPDHTRIAIQTENAMKAAVERLETKKAEHQKVQPVLRKARELDLKIAEKDAPVRAADKTIAEITASLDTLRIRWRKDSDTLADKRKKLEKLQQALKTSMADEGLVEHLAGIRGRFEVLKSLNVQLTAKLDEITHAENQVKESSAAWRKQVSHLENEKRKHAEIQISLTEKQAELLKILEDRELADWRQHHERLTAQGYLLAAAIEAAQALSESQKIAVELANRQTTLHAEVSALTAALSGHIEKQNTLEQEWELLETQLTLLKKIEALEDARCQLRDGDPCPLCGALKHPFAEGNVPAPDETRKRLTAVRKELKSVTAAISGLKVKRTSLNKDIEQAVSGRKDHMDRKEAAGRRIETIATQLSPDMELTASDPELNEKLKRLQEDNTRRLARITATIEAADTAGKALTTRREALEKAGASVVKAEHEVQTAIHKMDSAGQQCDRLKMEANGYREQQEKSLVQLQTEVRAFGVEALSVGALDDVLQQLTSRRDRWTARHKEKAELDQTIAGLEIQTSHQSEQIQKSETELKQRQEQRDHLLQERAALVRERRDIFGDKTPDDEESRLSADIEAADTQLDMARQKQISAHQELSRLKAGITELEQAIQARNLQLQASQEVFQRQIEASGFSDEESYKSACLPENERKRLAQHSQKLVIENTELTSREREKAGLLKIERQKQITEDTLEALQKALAVLEGDQKEFQQEIGGIRQKLKDNESLKAQQQERVCAITAQKRDCARWDMLHELIGSADGKKYRNFAQGLTFEMMVHHANRQLQKMTDRYLLIRDNTQPLELNVIDSYQAGEIRSTKNLSGGESFIVSLALALGLSHMASKNVRIDSLFLDEGFGALDEEALDTALETLASLRQDGKLIGVISHVPALQERIGTRIQVTPLTGGKSRILGPGCQNTTATNQTG